MQERYYWEKLRSQNCTRERKGAFSNAVKNRVSVDRGGGGQGNESNGGRGKAQHNCSNSSVAVIIPPSSSSHRPPPPIHTRVG